MSACSATPRSCPTARGARRTASQAATAACGVGLLVGQEGGEGLAVQRAGEEVALHRVAAELAQALELDLALDALGDDLQAERAGDLDDGGDDRRVLVLGADAGDERAVDLDRRRAGSASGAPATSSRCRSRR